MADRSSIEWTDTTWNPVRGCARVSDGCRNCYAERVAARFSGAGQPYEGLIHPSTRGWNGKVRLVPESLAMPWRITRGRRIFVNSMSDLFHEDVPFEFIAAVFWVMAHTTRHTYQILTKRPARALEFFTWLLDYDEEPGESSGLWPLLHADAAWRMGTSLFDAAHTQQAIKDLPWQPAGTHRGGYDNCGPSWPLENVWLGVSVEDQQTADERIPLLLHCPAAVRWISAEPLLGPVDLWRIPRVQLPESPLYLPHDWPAHMNALVPDTIGKDGLRGTYSTSLDWVVAGGESGPNARPMHPDWVRSLRHQCSEAGVPFLFKQWGEWGPYVNEDHYTHCGEEKHAHAWVDRDTGSKGLCWLIDDDGGWSNYTGVPPMHDDGQVLDRVAVMGKHGKKRAGRQLDGRLHDAYPQSR